MKKFIKNYSICSIAVLLLFSCTEHQKDLQRDSQSHASAKRMADTIDRTNNFYDNAEDHDLIFTNLSVEGEISNPGMVNFEDMPLHTVIVKETLLSENGDKFVGAYRYDGYSLFDILDNCNLEKKNKDEFPPIIDVYVEVENEAGEKARLSWGEIYYPNHLHEIIIATRVMRIVPSKTKDLWPLPSESRLIVGPDLITERNISSPSKITVLTYPKSFVTVKGMSPVYSPEIKIYLNDQPVETLDRIPLGMTTQIYHSIFYGRGRGIHSTQPFEGYMLKEILKTYLPSDRIMLRQGLVLVAAKDGYRGIFTMSEIGNRNDQSEVLLVWKPEEKDGGAFRLFPAGDFFSDRAIKSVESIYIINF